MEEGQDWVEAGANYGARRSGMGLCCTHFSSLSALSLFSQGQINLIRPSARHSALTVRFSVNIFNRSGREDPNFYFTGARTRTRRPCLRGKKNPVLEFRNITFFSSCLSCAEESIMSAVPHCVTIFLTQGVYIFSENVAATSKV
jgi:hypothetical protein